MESDGDPAVGVLGLLEFEQIAAGRQVAQGKEGLEVLKLGQRPDRDKAEA